MSVRGYKVFNPDWTCRGFQYEVGKTFKYDGTIGLCNAGFHFCQKLSDCFTYYKFNPNNKVAEVEAVGNVKTNGNKLVTDEITIVRELTWYEVLDLVNTGKGCDGIHNTGDGNIGNRNSGHCNRGEGNSGRRNHGSDNSGSSNIGFRNTGWGNSGNLNSGNLNNGNHNSGDWNATDYATGFFNNVEQPLYIFNKTANISRDDFYKLPAIMSMRTKYTNNWWVFSADMTDEEKASHPEHEITGGYLKTVDFKTACGLMWENMTDDEKESVKDIPNFDAEVFKEITGIVVE